MFSPIIERNSSLPCSCTKSYVTVADYQKSVTVDVYQGEEMLCKDNLCLGVIKAAVPPAPAGQESIDVCFTYDINGILAVDVRVASTDEHFSRVFSDSGSFSDEELAARLKELDAMRMAEADAFRAVYEKAQRLYAQCLGRDRDFLSLHMERFAERCKNAGLSQKTCELQRMETLLADMERAISGYGRLPADFEERSMQEEKPPIQ